MTMALPLAFAACTSDEFESFNNQGEALKNRKDLGQVALTVGGDAQTRWTGSMGAEVGDRIGAVLIDNKTADGSEDPMDDYTVSGTEIFTNYMYQNDGTAWRTNANLVEGNYYFYAPYVEYQGRGLLKFATPLVQTIDVDADGNIEPNSGIANYAEAAESPMVIGYKFLASTDDNTDVTISMKHLFAYPEFKFTNNSGEAVTLSRVLIENTGEGFVAGGGLNNEAIGGKSGKLFITGEQDAIEEAKDAYEAWNKKGDAPEFASWGAWQQVFAYDEGGQTIPTGLDKDLNAQSIEDLKTADLVANPTYSELIRVDFSDDVVVADGETISFRVIMPAGTYSTDKLTLYYVVPSGKAYAVKMKDVTTEKEITTLLQDRYTRQDYTNKGQLKTGAKQFESEIDEDATLENAPSVVTTTEALIDLIMEEKSNTEALNITLAGDDIEFNQDVMDAIAGMKSQSIKFSGKINIVGNTNSALVINENITFDEAVVKSGRTNLNNRSLTYGTLTIEKGATLRAINVAKENGVIVNKGTLEVGAATIPSVENWSNINYVGAGSITKLTVKGDTEAELKAQTITVGENSSFTYQYGALYTVVNNGTLNIPANADIAGSITNNGVIELQGTATNKATLTNADGAEINGKYTLTNEGTLTNNGTINCGVKNGEPTKDENGNMRTYTINANGTSKFMGKVEGTVFNKYNSLVVKDGAVLVNVDNAELATVYEVALTDDTELPHLIGAGAFINTLNVTGVNVTEDWPNKKVKAYEGAIKVLNVKGDINIKKGVTLTLPATVEEVNVSEDRLMEEGTLKFQNTTKLAKINIAENAKLTVYGGTIEGGAAKVEIVSLYEKPETIEKRGQFESIKGTLTNVVYDEEDGDWFVNNGGTVTAGTIAADTEINYNGEYKLGNDAKISKFGKDVTYVKLVADGNNKSAVIAKDLVGDKKNVHVLVGAGVTLTLGVGPGDYTGVADIDKAVTGEEGAILIIKRDQDAKRVWKDGKWEVSK